MILEPGHRKPFYFKTIKAKSDFTQQLLKLKFMDEVLSPSQVISLVNEGGETDLTALPSGLELTRSAKWSSPFSIANIQEFTVKMSTEGSCSRLNEIKDFILRTKLETLTS